MRSQSLTELTVAQSEKWRWEDGESVNRWRSTCTRLVPLNLRWKGKRRAADGRRAEWMRGPDRVDFQAQISGHEANEKVGISFRVAASQQIMKRQTHSTLARFMVEWATQARVWQRRMAANAERPSALQTRCRADHWIKTATRAIAMMERVEETITFNGELKDASRLLWLTSEQMGVAHTKTIDNTPHCHVEHVHSRYTCCARFTHWHICTHVALMLHMCIYVAHTKPRCTRYNIAKSSPGPCCRPRHGTSRDPRYAGILDD